MNLRAHPGFVQSSQRSVIVWQVKLLLKEKLDRESEPEYRMRLFAVDGGGTEAMTGTAMVTVHVIDVNDRRPRFSKPLYEVLVTENTPPGTVVVAVEAFDDDEAQNGVIDYQFAVSTQESSSSRIFSINNSTGQILVKVTLSTTTTTTTFRVAQ